jgi:hypothetical protein
VQPEETGGEATTAKGRPLPLRLIRWVSLAPLRWLRFERELALRISGRD